MHRRSERSRKAVLRRSRSIEVIVDDTLVKRNSLDGSTEHLPLNTTTFDQMTPMSRNTNSKSCDQLDCYGPQTTAAEKTPRSQTTVKSSVLPLSPISFASTNNHSTTIETKSFAPNVLLETNNNDNGIDSSHDVSSYGGLTVFTNKRRTYSRTANVVVVTLNKEANTENMVVVRLDDHIKARIEKRRDESFVNNINNDVVNSKETLNCTCNDSIRGNSFPNDATVTGEVPKGIVDFNRTNSLGNTNSICSLVRSDSNPPGDIDFSNSLVQAESTTLENFIESSSDISNGNNKTDIRSSIDNSFVSTASSHENSLSAALLSNRVDTRGVSDGENEGENSGGNSLFVSEQYFAASSPSRTLNGQMFNLQGDSSVLEDIAENDIVAATSPSASSVVDPVLTSASSSMEDPSRAANSNILMASVAISLDDSYLGDCADLGLGDDEKEVEGRRSTMDSQGTVNSSHDGDGKSGKTKYILGIIPGKHTTSKQRCYNNVACSIAVRTVCSEICTDKRLNLKCL